MGKILKLVWDYVKPHLPKGLIGWLVSLLLLTVSLFLGLVAYSIFVRQMTVTLAGCLWGVSDARSYSAGVPIGAIVPWVPPRAASSLEEARKQLPVGFLLCEGPQNTDDPKTQFDETRIPNLLDERFLMGGAPSQVGTKGGTNWVDWSHTHTVAVGTRMINAGGSAGIGGGNDQISGGTGSASKSGGDNRPNYLCVLFVIRVN